jgi:hypothetical protein
LAALLTLASPAAELVNTGLPDGKLGALSRPGSGGSIETEAADDFILNSGALITGATFYGLIESNVAVSDINEVIVEIYRVFPLDSDAGRMPNVTTRMNSPSDVAFDSRDSASAGELSFNAASLGAFSVGNSVVNGINPKPNQQTGGKGPVSGQEVQFNINFLSPLMLPAGHYFFVPQVVVPGDFLWLTSPKPIVAPGTPFMGDLQAWIRNENLAPDWSRIGTDIVGPPATGAPAPTFNEAFALDGQFVPEPSSIALMLGGLLALGWKARRKK